MANKWQEKNKREKVCKAMVAAHAGNDIDSLKDMRDLIASIQRYKKLDKLSSTFVKGPIKAILNNGYNRVHPQYNFATAVTGRLTCSAYSTKGKNAKKGVSFHTLPKKDKKLDYNIRGIYNCPKGFVFGQADYSAAELRVLASIAKVKNMLKAFRDGVDLHSTTASMAFNLPIGDCGKGTLERDMGKTGSFLTVYGGGPPNLAATCGISLKKAEWFFEQFFRVYPEIPQFMDFIADFIERNEYAYTIFGRRRHLENIRSRNKQVKAQAIRQGVNFTIQSAASDVLLCAMLGIYKDFKRLGLESRLCATVHDSIEFYTKIEEMEIVASIVHYNMTENPEMKKLGVKLEVEMEVDMGFGHTFGDELEVEFKGHKALNLGNIRETLMV